MIDGLAIRIPFRLDIAPPAYKILGMRQVNTAVMAFSIGVDHVVRLEALRARLRKRSRSVLVRQAIETLLQRYEREPANTEDCGDGMRGAETTS